MRAAALRPAELQELLAAAQLALLHVGAAREGAAGAAQDGDLRRLVGVEAVQRVAQRADQLVAEGIELLRAVEGQRDDLPVLLIVHERHRFPFASLVGLCHASRQNREETMAMHPQGGNGVAVASRCSSARRWRRRSTIPGASDSEIKLGQTMPYSGPLSGFITWPRPRSPISR